MAEENIIISEILCYIQNKMDCMSHDFVIKIVTEFYTKENISSAKRLLFDECVETGSRCKKYNIDSAKLDSRDIITKFNEVGADSPVFVAKNVANLPLATPDAFNLAKISKDITDVLRIEENVVSSFAALSSIQNDFKIVIEKCNMIDEISEQLSEIKAAVEKKNARRIIVSSSN